MAVSTSGGKTGFLGILGNGAPKIMNSTTHLHAMLDSVQANILEADTEFS